MCANIKYILITIAFVLLLVFLSQHSGYDIYLHSRIQFKTSRRRVVILFKKQTKVDNSYKTNATTNSISNFPTPKTYLLCTIWFIPFYRRVLGNFRFTVEIASKYNYPSYVVIYYTVFFVNYFIYRL